MAASFRPGSTVASLTARARTSTGGSASAQHSHHQHTASHPASSSSSSQVPGCEGVLSVVLLEARVGKDLGATATTYLSFVFGAARTKSSPAAPMRKSGPLGGRRQTSVHWPRELCTLSFTQPANELYISLWERRSTSADILLGETYVALSTLGDQDTHDDWWTLTPKRGTGATAGLECDVHMCITYRQYDALKIRCSNLSAELAETTSRHLAAELQAQTAARGSVSMNSALPLTVSALGGIGGDTATQAKLMNDLEGKLSKSHNENVMLAREFKRALKDAAAAKAEVAALKQRDLNSSASPRMQQQENSPSSSSSSSSHQNNNNNNNNNHSNQMMSPTRGGGSKLSHMEMKVRAMQIEESRLRSSVSELSVQKDDDERRIKQLELELSMARAQLGGYGLGTSQTVAPLIPGAALQTIDTVRTTTVTTADTSAGIQQAAVALDGLATLRSTLAQMKESMEGGLQQSRDKRAEAISWLEGHGTSRR